ncbi:MAG TPA: hypothetical protein RMH99_19000 [Sandaracinaceae bacterium LLY-WYZ-13_1]|nr:hypothetical protein [Sandaracinaceae bacterium LLY-WYZ-13_1]
MKTTRWIALVIALGLAACGSEGTEESETPAAETPPAEAQEATEEIEEAVEEAAEEAEETAEEAEETAEEATEAAEGEGTPCEQAFASVQALRQQLEERMGGENQAEPLDRDAYLERCNELPEGAQRCMILGYAAEHGEECAQYQEQIQGANAQQ